jgi:hypothetical protein
VRCRCGLRKSIEPCFCILVVVWVRRTESRNRISRTRLAHERRKLRPKFAFPLEEFECSAYGHISLDVFTVPFAETMDLKNEGTKSIPSPQHQVLGKTCLVLRGIVQESWCFREEVLVLTITRDVGYEGSGVFSSAGK